MVDVGEQFAGGAKPPFPLRQTVWQKAPLLMTCFSHFKTVPFAVGTISQSPLLVYLYLFVLRL